MLGSTLVTHQTGPHGKEVNRLYIEDGSAIDARILSLGLLVDRETSRIAFVVSTEGGMDIEEVARTTPGEDRHVHDRSGDRHHARSMCAACAGARPRRRSAPSSATLLTKLYAPSSRRT